METVNAGITKFDLKALGKRLKSERAWHEKKRNSFNLLKDGTRHVYLIAVHAATPVPDHRTPCPVDIHVLEGRVRLVTDRETFVLDEGELAVLEAGIRYRLESEAESLLTLEFFPSGSIRKNSGDEDDYFDNWV